MKSEFRDELTMVIASNDITLENLSKLMGMSVRAVNACNYLRLNTLKEILRYYEQHDVFERERSIGAKTCKEFDALCKLFKEDPEIMEMLNNKSEPELSMEALNGLSLDEKNTLYRYVSHNYHRLPVRVKKKLSEYMGGDISAPSILQSMFTSYVELIIKGKFGEKSSEQLKAFYNEIKAFAKRVISLDSTELTREHTRFVSLDMNPTLDVKDTEFVDSIIDENGKIKLFLLLDSLVRKDFVFKEDHDRKNVFLLTYTDCDDDERNYIINRIEVGVERARQIKVDLSLQIHGIFDFVNRIRSGYFRQYGDDPHSPAYLVDLGLLERINSNEGTRFNLHLFEAIFSIRLKESHDLIASPKMPKTRKKDESIAEFIYPCFIRKDLNQNFDFKGFIKRVSEKASEQISKDRKLPLEILMSGLIKDTSSILSPDTYEACRSIIRQTPRLEIDSYDNIIQRLNINRPKLTEYIIEALVLFDKPASDDDISKQINTRYPELKTDRSKVRLQILRDRENFMAFGLTGLYGLRRWETEKSDVHKGTIRDIVEEYLMGQAEPKHLSEITKHVKRYHKTNEKSVRNNIENDDKKRFQKLPGSFYGIYGKDYGDLSSFKSIAAPAFRKSVLEKWDGQNFEDFLNHYMSKYGYQKIQVRSIIESKRKNGELSITSDGRMIIH